MTRDEFVKDWQHQMGLRALTTDSVVEYLNRRGDGLTTQVLHECCISLMVLRTMLEVSGLKDGAEAAADINNRISNLLTL